MTLSIIIPTFNEADQIARRVDDILKLARKEILEVLVVDGGSTDKTGERALRSGATVLQAGRSCRAAQLNLGARHALGEILYFVHADVKLLPSFVDDIRDALSEGYVSGCYRYVFDSGSFMLKVNAFFTRFSPLMCRGGDQTLYVSRPVFRALRGFNEAFEIMEDYEFLTRLRRRFSFKIIPKDIVVSARKYESNSWLRVQMANLSVFIMFFLRRSPREMKQIYKILLTYR